MSMFAGLFRMLAGKFPVSPEPFVDESGIAHAAVSRVVQVDYTGDNTNDRLLAMGIPCDIACIVRRTAADDDVDHLACAWAFSDTFGAFYEKGDTQEVRHSVNNADAQLRFQGIVGTDLKLGSDGDRATGSNDTGVLYRAIGISLRDFP